MTAPTYLKRMGSPQLYDPVKTMCGGGVTVIPVEERGNLGEVQISAGAGPLCRYPEAHARQSALAQDRDRWVLARSHYPAISGKGGWIRLALSTQAPLPTTGGGCFLRSGPATSLGGPSSRNLGVESGQSGSLFRDGGRIGTRCGQPGV